VNAFKIIQLIAKGIPPARWTVSHNGLRKGPVTKADCGLNAPLVWLRFDYQEDGNEQRLDGTIPITGGEETIQFNGKDVGFDDIVLSHRIVGFPPKIVLVVEFKFELNGADHRIRFDAPVG